ncbi:MAG TPA: hypothetical protein VIJ85_14220 [Rhizomicrobium sp.]
MSKFGVGVGDDFPVDDGSGNAAGGDQAPRDDREDYEEWKRRREAHRAQREQWRAQREEWRNRKRAFKEKVRAAARESFGAGRDDYDDVRHDGGRYGYRRHRFPFFLWPMVGLLIPILVIGLLISLIAAIFKSPFLFLALILAAFLVFGFRRHHWAGHRGWHDHGRGRDYDFDLKPSRAPSQPPQPSVVVTPPPAPQDGGK